MVASDVAKFKQTREFDLLKECVSIQESLPFVSSDTLDDSSTKPVARFLEIVGLLSEFLQVGSKKDYRFMYDAETIKAARKIMERPIDTYNGKEYTIPEDLRKLSDKFLMDVDSQITKIASFIEPSLKDDFSATGLEKFKCDFKELLTRFDNMWMEFEREYVKFEADPTIYKYEAPIKEACLAIAAQPDGLQAWEDLLEDLDKKDLMEIQAMASPPPAVMIVCMCVVILRPLGKEDESAGWAGAKAMLSDISLLQALCNYKKDKMTQKKVQKIRFLLNKEKETFEGEKMKSVSKAGYALLQWVLAMVKYYESNQNKALIVFKANDANGDGTISEGKLKSALLKIGMTEQVIAASFQQADANKDGAIDYKKFIAWVYGSS